MAGPAATAVTQLALIQLTQEGEGERSNCGRPWNVVPMRVEMAPCGWLSCLFMFSDFSAQNSKVDKCSISNGSLLYDRVFAEFFAAPELVIWYRIAIVRSVLLICIVLGSVVNSALINSWGISRWDLKMECYVVSEAVHTLLSPKRCGMYVNLHKHRRLSLAGLVLTRKNVAWLMVSKLHGSSSTCWYQWGI